MSLLADPPLGCAHCPRLNAFIAEWRAREPGWFNGPVPTFTPAGADDAVRLLVIGLAPGLRGANRTGRPFTGDFAGTLLYQTLIRFGFARGSFDARPDDGLELVDAAVTNAVRCVPPENKPVGKEVTSCRERFLVPTIARFPNLQAIVTLGRIAHDSTARALGQRPSALPFAHGAARDAAGLRIFSSYHCSRYNTNTGVLTEAMFVEVFGRVRDFLGNRVPNQ